MVKKKVERTNLKGHIDDLENLITEINKCDIPKECEDCEQLWECHAHTRVMVKFLIKSRIEDLKFKPGDIVKIAKKKMKEKVKKIEDYTAEMTYI